jgi:CTP:molybdopterin cytidylyltransferase MocA
MAARSADAALASSARPVVVVVGAHAGAVRESLGGRGVVVAENPLWEEGLASSIRAGLSRILEIDPGIDAVLLAPCDQPGLTPQVIESLAALCRETGCIAAARYGGRNGAPAVFGREHFPLLQGLSGDEGARRILNGGLHPVQTIDLPDLALDLDTPGDYSDFEAR